MGTTYDIGEKIRVSWTQTSTNSTAIDSNVTFHYETPAGTVTTTTRASSTAAGSGIVRSTQGGYYYDVTTTGKGLYEYRITPTGTLVASTENWFNVRPRRVTT